MGNVLLSGDLMHFRENYDTNGVPAFNTDRAQTLASLDRAKKIVAGSSATVIIQHDPRDLDKLPTFPASAKKGQPPGIQIGGRRGARLALARVQSWRVTEQISTTAESVVVSVSPKISWGTAWATVRGWPCQSFEPVL